MPCQRPSMVTPFGGAPPVSRNRATAALNVACGTVQLMMYFMEGSAVFKQRVMWLSTYASLHPNPIGTLGCSSVRLGWVERRPLSRPFLCRYRTAEVCNGSDFGERQRNIRFTLKSRHRWLDRLLPKSATRVQRMPPQGYDRAASWTRVRSKPLLL